MIYTNYRILSNPFDLGVDEYLKSYTDPHLPIHIVGYMPEIEKNLVAGKIWLYRGRHAWKYGLDHIWQGRRVELQKRGIYTVRQLINFLIQLISKNTPIYPEPEHYKAAIIKSSKGAVIVENIDDYYSTVTLLLATPASPLQVEKRWGYRKLNTIKIDCKTI